MNTKTKSYLLLLTTLIIGFGAGFLANGFLVKRKLTRMHQMMSQQATFTQQVMSGTQLTPEEKALVEPILAAHFQQIKTLQQTHRTELKDTFQKLKSELSTVLPQEKVQEMTHALRLRRHRNRKPPRHDRPHDGPPPPHHVE